jgi:hypothetical protein
MAAWGANTLVGRIGVAEGPVSSEPVSTFQIPCSYGKIQGIARFCRLSGSIREAECQGFGGFRGQIPYAAEQGIFELYQ